MIVQKKPIIVASISVSPSNQGVNMNSGITLTLENVSVFLGILLSLTALSAIVINLINNQNRISTAIEQIEKSLKEYAANTQRLHQVERALDLHVRDYTNQNKILQLVLEQLNQKSEDKIQQLNLDIKDLQKFLQRESHFIVRTKVIAEVE